MNGDPERCDAARPGRTGSSTWSLFRDWCAATEHSALPAAPATLAQFLDAHPATTSTQRRRVADIDTAHRRRGLAEPGKTVTIRLAVNERRREQADRVRAAAASIIGQVPANGWPGGLFGRRDAMILTLLASGMTPTEITALRRGDVTVEGLDLVVCGDHRVPRGLFGDRPRDVPAAIYMRWAQILALLDQAATGRMIAAVLDPTRSPGAHASVDAVPAAHANEPLLMRIDRWGHAPWVPDPLTSRSASVLTRTYLTGHPPTHRCDPAAAVGGYDAANPAPMSSIEDDLDLATSYYAEGIVARRRAHERLSDVSARFDEVDDRTDALLLRLADIVECAQRPEGGGRS